MRLALVGGRTARIVRHSSINEPKNQYFWRFPARVQSGTIDLMSMIDFRSKQVDKEKARKTVREIVSRHATNVVFSSHAQEELRKDGYSIMDGWNVLKASSSKIVRNGELDNKTAAFRYRLETNQIALVIQFRPNGKGLVVITGWAKKGAVR